MDSAHRDEDATIGASTGQAPQEFTDFLVYKNVTTNSRGRNSNIIKANLVRMHGGEYLVRVPGSDADQPTVVVHRAGDAVRSVEFLCKCGRSAVVGVEYEGE